MVILNIMVDPNSKKMFLPPKYDCKINFHHLGFLASEVFVTRADHNINLVWIYHF